MPSVLLDLYLPHMDQLPLSPVSSLSTPSNRSSTGQHPRVLCLGDSLTAGLIAPHVYHPYAIALKKQLGVPVDEIGMSGARADEIMGNMSKSHCSDIFGKVACGLLTQLAKREYTVCIIMAGTNDINSGRKAESALSDVIKLHTTCHQRGLKTVALPIPESRFILDPHSMLHAAERRTFNASLQMWAAQQTGKVLYVDMASQVPFSDLSGDWSMDGLHMSKQGYNNFGNRLSYFVKSFILNAKPVTKGKLPAKGPVTYRRTTGEVVKATVVGPSPMGPEYLAIEYEVGGQMMRNQTAPVAAINPVTEERAGL